MMRWICSVVVMMLALPAHAAGSEQEATLAVHGGVLHGTLSLPDGQGKVPVVLLHAGSGPTDRNGNSAMLPGQNNALRMLAEALARNGIATLRYDKRGIGASASAGRREADLRLDDYIDDATAWLRQLRADPRFTNVLMAGHSEGALIAMVACQKAQLDGCVLIAGAGNALDDILCVQLKPRLPPELYAQNERILLALKRGEQVNDVPPALLALYRPSVQPYLISSMQVDPRAVVGALRMPLLILPGGDRFAGVGGRCAGLVGRRTGGQTGDCAGHEPCIENGQWRFGAANAVVWRSRAAAGARAGRRGDGVCSGTVKCGGVA